jgi:hypothetical protein
VPTLSVEVTSSSSSTAPRASYRYATSLPLSPRATPNSYRGSGSIVAGSGIGSLAPMNDAPLCSTLSCGFEHQMSLPSLSTLESSDLCESDLWRCWFPAMAGWMGMHHWYLGRRVFGVVYMLSFGLFGIGW